eukprot:TRINITY_DN209_c0_g1_i4.p1 TRINITY_DN209_c0_g1~~TRINITY_DN209_c0_g1_i4.p1  ORF type:complete len:100 (+),score=15.98 TRINITY_DN209_c0_g1_i4:77-376(+)
MSDIEETLRRIENHKGFLGYIIVNAEGIPIRSKGLNDNALVVQYSALVTQLATKARSVVRDIDATNDLTFLRVRSKKHEIMIAPDKDYVLIVIQDPDTA